MEFDETVALIEKVQRACVVPVRSGQIGEIARGFVVVLKRPLSI